MLKTTLRVLLMLLALLFLALMGFVALYMLYPVNMGSKLSSLGAFGLNFPLHLFTLGVAAILLFVLSRALGANRAAGIYAVLVCVTVFLALWPSVVMWQMARRERVPISLATYLQHSLRANPDVIDGKRTLEYGIARDGTKLLLDVWEAEKDEAAGTALHGAVVRLHGGDWRSGSRGMGSDWNRWLNDLGYDVFDVDYRLPGGQDWKDQVGDVKCALGWVRANAQRYGIDPARIVLWGHSFGGNLAMLASYSPADPQLPPSCEAQPVKVRAVVNFYGPTDLTLLWSTTTSAAYVHAALERYVGGSPTTQPDRYRLLSPLFRIGAETPATITFLGASDRVVAVDQAQQLDEALAKAGVPHETYILPATDHGFDVNWGGFGTQFARAKLTAFLEKNG